MVISQSRLLQVAIYCNAIYVFLLFLFRPDGINVQKLIISGFLVVSVLSVFILAIKNFSALNYIPKTIKWVLYALGLWSIVVVVRGVSLNLQDWVTNFGNVYMALAWFVPTMLLIGSKIEIWKDLFKGIFFMFALMIVAFFTLPFFYNNLKTEWTWLLRPVNFILVMGIYKKTKDKFFTVALITLMYIIIAHLVKQRIEYLFLFLVFTFLIIDKLRRLKWRILKYVFFGFIFVLWVIFTYGYEYISIAISYVVEFQDSRTFLFTELFTDLSKTETYIGRGSLGSYYSDFFERTRRYYLLTGGKSWVGDSPVRITIEVSFLQMVLKGGYILFVLTAYLMLYGAYVGIFKSKNKFCRRLGVFILILTILSIVSFRPAFTPMFIIFWAAIGTVLNKNNRDMSNEEIRNILNY